MQNFMLNGHACIHIRPWFMELNTLSYPVSNLNYIGQQADCEPAKSFAW